VLLRRPPGVIAARFGTDSFRKHRDGAEVRGVPFAEVDLPETAFDLDRREDIPMVLEHGGPSRTRAACLEMGLAERLSVVAE
jgi:2-phospho-L-lactate guanylyltransferase (CobY/MobA/RfbA family)